MKIICDIDEVMWDDMSVNIEWYNSLTSSNLTKDDFIHWEIDNVIPEPRQSLFWAIRTWAHFWDNVKPIKDANEYVYKLYKQHDMYFVTATDLEHCEEKIHHFLKLFPWVDPQRIIVCHNKQLINADIRIDDAIHNLVGGNGLKIVFSQPWNQSFDVDNTLDMERFDNWADIYAYICNIEDYSRLYERFQNNFTWLIENEEIGN